MKYHKGDFAGHCFIYGTFYAKMSFVDLYIHV